LSRRFWLPGLIALGAFCLFFIGEGFTSTNNVRAQFSPVAIEGIQVIPLQLGREAYGIAMVDTVGQTLWVYEINSRGPAYNRLRLFAARSWRYDKLLKEYNTADPKPERVKQILETLVQAPQQAEKNVSETGEPEGDSAIIK